MKIEPIEIIQTFYEPVYVDVSETDIIQITGSKNTVYIERDKIQELIDILEHEKI